MEKREGEDSRRERMGESRGQGEEGRDLEEMGERKATPWNC